MKHLMQRMFGVAILLVATAGNVGADPVPLAEPLPITPGPSNNGGEFSVEDVIEDLPIDDLNLDTVVDVDVDQALQTLVFSCALGTQCTGSIIIEQAGLAGVNQMGIYDLSDVGADPDRVAVFVGADAAGATSFFEILADGSVLVDGSDTGTNFGSGPSFGLYIENTNGVFFSEDARNLDGNRHVLFYHTETGGTVDENGVEVPDHSFIFAFEDLPEGNVDDDFDYNDFLYTFEQIQARTNQPVPEPASMLLFGMGMAGAGLTRRRRKA